MAIRNLPPTTGGLFGAKPATFSAAFSSDELESLGDANLGGAISEYLSQIGDARRMGMSLTDYCMANLRDREGFSSAADDPRHSKIKAALESGERLLAEKFGPAQPGLSGRTEEQAAALAAV